MDSLHLARWGFEEEWRRWATMESYGARLVVLAGLAYGLGLATAGVATHMDGAAISRPGWCWGGLPCWRREALGIWRAPPAP
ncbi:hypothetical protein, partial [Methylogaea oryzae]|uniref:hypothetical protein n=1 Tax=Methylogaea oryzae TaxID=1295382 RepID=UPI0012E1075C